MGAAVKRLADANLDDDDTWRNVPKEKREGYQRAAQILMGYSGEGEAAAVFNAAMAKDGNPNSLTLEEAKQFVQDPKSFTRFHVVEGVKLDTTGINAKEIQNAKSYIQLLREDVDGSKLIKKVASSAAVGVRPSILARILRPSILPSASSFWLSPSSGLTWWVSL